MAFNTFWRPPDKEPRGLRHVTSYYLKATECFFSMTIECERSLALEKGNAAFVALRPSPHVPKRSFFSPFSLASFQEHLRPHGSISIRLKNATSCSRRIGGAVFLEIHRKRRGRGGSMHKKLERCIQEVTLEGCGDDIIETQVCVLAVQTNTQGVRF